MRLLDGPAKGQDLLIRRCPTFLRLVQNSRGQWDALDQLIDEPKLDETIYVYELIPGSRMTFFVRPGGRYETGDYRYVGEAPTDLLRDTKDWRDWTMKQPPAET